MHIDSIEPETVRITVRGGARVRVRGRGFGRLRCGEQRRWVCGAFDETFLLECATEGTVDVVGAGLGRCRASVHWAPVTDVSPPGLPTLRVPQTRPRKLASRVPEVPAVIPLTSEQLWAAEAERCEPTE